MPKKSKPKKIKVLAARQLSTPEKPASKKKVKLTRQSHSSSEIYQLQTNSSVDDDNVDTPPLSNSRPTSPLNFFSPNFGVWVLVAQAEKSAEIGHGSEEGQESFVVLLSR